MSTPTSEQIAMVLRAIAPDKKLRQEDVPHVNALAANWRARAPVDNTAPHIPGEVPWIVNARSKIGRREIVGPKHNPWIVDGWKRLKAGWFNDDETPWCGFFVADCLNDVGLPYPKNFPSAASFATHGTACSSRLGAIGVKARPGGNHVFFITGETADKLYYKGIGGNQSNMVSEAAFLKSGINHIRWPAGYPLVDTGLPVLPRGTVSSREG